MYLNFDSCYKYHVENEIVVKSVVNIFSCPPHEEADTKINEHICNVEYDANVCIKCSDTDILIIMLGNISKLKSDIEIWMEVGVGDSLRHIKMNQIPLTWKASYRQLASRDYIYSPDFVQIATLLASNASARQCLF